MEPASAILHGRATGFHQFNGRESITLNYSTLAAATSLVITFYRLSYVEVLADGVQLVE